MGFSALFKSGLNTESMLYITFLENIFFYFAGLNDFARHFWKMFCFHFTAFLLWNDNV